MLTKNLENEITMKSNTLDIHMIIEKDRKELCLYKCVYMYLHVVHVCLCTMIRFKSSFDILIQYSIMYGIITVYNLRHTIINTKM